MEEERKKRKERKNKGIMKIIYPKENMERRNNEKGDAKINDKRNVELEETRRKKGRRERKEERGTRNNRE